MSLFEKLCETYDNCIDKIGEERKEKEYPYIPLFPLHHTTVDADITVILNSKGEFMEASIVPINDNTTIIPCTEDSAAARTSGVEPHPLCDRLDYLAPNFKKYTKIDLKNIKDGVEKTSNIDPYKEHLKLLKAWYEYSKNIKLYAILNYVEKRDLIKDLVKSKIITDNPNELSKIGEIKKPQSNLFIRWEVQIKDIPQSKTWLDRELWKSWADYYTNTLTKKGFCFITGKNNQFLTRKHPAKIRGKGDKAKIISSNDTINMTYRGNFRDADEACTVSVEASQKMHSVLRWLIRKQGISIGGTQDIITWSTSDFSIPSIDEGTSKFYSNEDYDDSKNNTNELAAEKIRKLIPAYIKNWNRRVENVKTEDIENISGIGNVMILITDGATQGRLAINYYRELEGSDFLQRLIDWHTAGAWWQSEYDGKEKRSRYYTGIPSLPVIFDTIYGGKNKGNFKKFFMRNMISSIIDGTPILDSIVKSAGRTASRYESFKGKYADIEWERALNIACSLYKIKHKNRRYDMALDETNTSRSYLYGRLLACADKLQRDALENQFKESKEQNRPTAARNLCYAFSMRPRTTWMQILRYITPYERKADVSGYYCKSMINKITSMFDPKDWMSDKPLDDEYQLGYSCQMQDFYKSKKKENKEDEEK